MGLPLSAHVSVTGQVARPGSEKGCQEQTLLLQALLALRAPSVLAALSAAGSLHPRVAQEARGFCSPAVGWQLEATAQTAICPSC